MKEDTRTFKINPNIEMKEVHFKNRYGIELAGHLYLPEKYQTKKNAAIVVAGPFGAVKEQAAGLHAQQMATYGYVTLAFDPSLVVKAVVKLVTWHLQKSLQKIIVQLLTF